MVIVQNKKLPLTDRALSIIVFSLFFSWLLAFPFEGQVLYALAEKNNINPHTIIFGAIGAHFAGLTLCGFFIKTAKAAKRLMIVSIIYCLAGSVPFFFTASGLWSLSLISASLLASGCVAAWGFFLKNCTPSNERIKTVADGLIYSNVLMIFINMAAIHVSPYAGLSLSMLMLVGALFFAIKLPEEVQSQKANFGEAAKAINSTHAINPTQALIFLCVFITVITINSGLMYQVINPAFAHHKFLVSSYWAVPYIIALYIMKNLPRQTNRTYILYVAIAMIGLSFVFFMILDRSAPSYLVVNTLMLGACGVYDLFWWSILGEMLDFYNNPATIMGIGLSYNVLGVLIGGVLGNTIISSGITSLDPSVLALIIVFIILIILPPLHKRLSLLLSNHVYLSALSEMSATEQSETIDSFTKMAQLTEREKEIAALLLTGRTYKMIANQLSLSENTVKTHIKNIYSKYNIQSKTELITLLTEKESSGPNQFKVKIKDS